MSAIRSYSLIFFLHCFHSSKHPILHKRKNKKKRTQRKPLSFSFLKHQTSRLGHVSIDYSGRRMELGPHHCNINAPPKWRRSRWDLWSLCFMQGCVMCNQQLPSRHSNKPRTYLQGQNTARGQGLCATGSHLFCLHDFHHKLHISCFLGRPGQ